MAKAINSLAGALFTIHGTGDAYERLKEFLAVRQLPSYLHTTTRFNNSSVVKRVFCPF